MWIIQQRYVHLTSAMNKTHFSQCQHLHYQLSIQSSWIHLVLEHIIHSLPVLASSAKYPKQTQHLSASISSSALFLDLFVTDSSWPLGFRFIVLLAVSSDVLEELSPTVLLNTSSEVSVELRLWDTLPTSIVNACILLLFSLLWLFCLFSRHFTSSSAAFCAFSSCLRFSFYSFSCFSSVSLAFAVLFLQPFSFFTFSCNAFRHSALVRTCALPVFIVLVWDVLGTGTLSRSIKGDRCVPLAVVAAAEFPSDVGVFPPSVSCWVVI